MTSLTYATQKKTTDIIQFMFTGMALLLKLN